MGSRVSGGGGGVENDGRSGRPKDATTEENVWLCVMEGKTCEAQLAMWA